MTQIEGDSSAAAAADHLVTWSFGLFASILFHVSRAHQFSSIPRRPLNAVKERDNNNSQKYNKYI